MSSRRVGKKGTVHGDAAAVVVVGNNNDGSSGTVFAGVLASDDTSLIDHHRHFDSTPSLSLSPSSPSPSQSTQSPLRRQQQHHHHPHPHHPKKKQARRSLVADRPSTMSSSSAPEWSSSSSQRLSRRKRKRSSSSSASCAGLLIMGTFNGIVILVLLQVWFHYGVYDRVQHLQIIKWSSFPSFVVDMNIIKNNNNGKSAEYIDFRHKVYRPNRTMELQDLVSSWSSSSSSSSLKHQSTSHNQQPEKTQHEEKQQYHPILVVGMPKAGTSTIFHFFACYSNGMLHTQHWYCCGQQRHAQRGGPHYMSHCMLSNIQHGKPILDGCGDYDVYTELNGPRPKRDRGTTRILSSSQSTTTTTTTTTTDAVVAATIMSTNIEHADGSGRRRKNVTTVMQQHERKNRRHQNPEKPSSSFTNSRRTVATGPVVSSTTKTRKPGGLLLPSRGIFLPQKYYLQELHEYDPYAPWILNIRLVDDWVESVFQTPRLARHIVEEVQDQQQQQQQQKQQKKQQHHHKGDDPTRRLHQDNNITFPRGRNETRIFLRAFYLSHIDQVRTYCQTAGHPLIEVNITDQYAGVHIIQSLGWERLQTHHQGRGGGGKETTTTTTATTMDRATACWGKHNVGEYRQNLEKGGDVVGR